MILHKTKTQASSLAKNEILVDYKLAYMSRQAALLGRKEVLSGKAKFGIFGDGKEIAQIAMAKVFQKGDWRSGYYRDQTFMLAVDQTTVRQFFSQLDFSTLRTPVKLQEMMFPINTTSIIFLGVTLN